MKEHPNKHIDYDVACSSLPWGGRWSTVVVDPPWSTQGPSSDPPPGYYRERLLSDYEISQIPIPKILNPDAYVFLWTFGPHTPAAYRILEGWGLDYLFTMTWTKETTLWTPEHPAMNAEYCLVGRKGSPPAWKNTDWKISNAWKRSGLAHSQKPPDFYSLLNAVAPPPRLDVFNRRTIRGFGGWGKESPYNWAEQPTLV